MIIGFGHRACQGKNLCCDAILEKCAYSSLTAKIYEFSAEVLAHCIANDLLPQDTVRAFLAREQKHILQHVGLEMRGRDENFWIDKLRERIAKDRPQIALIPNIRFPNEAAWVKADGGVCVLVERFNPDGSPYISPDRDPNHVSETALRAWPWDYRLSAQTGDSRWLQHQARALFSHLRNI